jgi:hypothetical protein
MTLPSVSGAGDPSGDILSRLLGTGPPSSPRARAGAGTGAVA